MYLEQDLYAIDQKLLVKSGEKITRGVLNKIVGLSGKTPFMPIKKWMMRDFVLCFEDKRYDHIFYPPAINKKIFRCIQRLKMPEKVFAEMAFMKRFSAYTYHHILIIAILSTKIALDPSLRMKLDPNKVLLTSLLHDIGKSRIPLSILDKQTPLTFNERRILNAHTIIGYLLLHYYFGNDHSCYTFSSLQHHERLDGSGYPRGIKKLNKYSQLISVVDALDALISERPYRRRAFSLRAAIDLLLEEADRGKFNKKLVETLIIYARRDPPGKKIIIGERGRDKAPEDNCYGLTAPS